MKTTKRFLTVLALLMLPTAGRCQTSPSKTSLTIRLPQSTVKAGAFVNLEIDIKNVSGHTIMVGRTVGSAEASYDIVVTGSDGKPAMETSYVRKVHGKESKGNLLDTHSEMLVELKPGQTTDDQIYLSKIYDFRLGEYTVQVSQTTYASNADVKAGRKTVTKSNSVTLTVTK